MNPLHSLSTAALVPLFRGSATLGLIFSLAGAGSSCFAAGEPIRVKEGQRVLFHILNASATENIQLALPGHQFLVVGLDGNPVPHPQMVDVLELGTAERIDAVVEMKNPGVWILGTPKNDDRMNGMGIVIEYAAPASGQEPPQCQGHRDQPHGDPKDNPHRQVRVAHAEFRIARILGWLMMHGHDAFSVGQVCFQDVPMSFTDGSHPATRAPFVSKQFSSKLFRREVLRREHTQNLLSVLLGSEEGASVCGSD